MNRRSLSIFGLVFALGHLSFAQAAPSASAQTEINYLLEFVARSGCQFYRNGSWYDSKQAQAHLRRKYDALAAENRINTAEEFIEQAATKSSLSGEAYAIRCRNDPVMSTNQWLRDVLARHRSAPG
jgi:Family of unknown function (DUF5329)